MLSAAMGPAFRSRRMLPDKRRIRRFAWLRPSHSMTGWVPHSVA